MSRGVFLRRHLILLLTLPPLLVGCEARPADRPSPAEDRAAIEAEIAAGVEATRTQDIDAYMARIPADLAVHDESGEVFDRQRLREETLRAWRIIPRTLTIRVDVDSMTIQGDSAVVWTSQDWTRLMLQRDGVTVDTVRTTQRHRELWRRTPDGWFGYEIDELGGRVWVNGEPYDPGG